MKSVLYTIVLSTALFAGCKSEPAIQPIPQPAPVIKPVAPEAQKNPANPGTEAPKMPMPADVQGILKLAVENLLKAKSVSSEMMMDVEMLGVKMNLAFDIEKSGDITYTNVELPGGMRFEAYSDGKNTVILEPMTRKWTRLPPEQGDMMTSLEQIQHKIYGDNIKNAVLAGEEKLNDRMCRVIDASVKAEVFTEILAKQSNPMMEGLDIKFDNASLKMWVEDGTCLIYKALLNMEATMTGDIPGMPGSEIEDEDESAPKTPSTKPGDSEPKTTRIKYEIEVNNSDYNNVAPIVIPPEAKSVLEQVAVPQPDAPANK